MASNDELDKLIDGALRQIKPVLKPENGSGLMHMDSAKLLLKIDLSVYILAQVKELVGPHISLTEEEIKGGRIYRIGDPQGDAVDRYKDELVKAAQARFGAEEGKR